MSDRWLPHEGVYLQRKRGPGGRCKIGPEHEIGVDSGEGGGGWYNVRPKKLPGEVFLPLIT